jgi:hypothetical protein
MRVDLPAPLGTQEAETFALVDGEVHALDRVEIPVVFGQLLGLDKGLNGHRSLRKRMGHRITEGPLKENGQKDFWPSVFNRFAVAYL